MTFGKTLRAQRQAAGLTQQKLACAAGTSIFTVNMLENEHFLPKYETVQKMARGLNLGSGQRSRLFSAAGFDGWWRVQGRRDVSYQRRVA
jgi:transcriptional regulator with XRE-family HTH domain